MDDELLFNIAMEAHMLGRIYNEMGEPKTPGEVCAHLKEMIERKKALYIQANKCE